MTVAFGAIVLTDFPFTDLTAAKRRPALVISADNDRRTDLVVAYITSVHRAETDAIRHLPDFVMAVGSDRSNEPYLSG